MFGKNNQFDPPVKHNTPRQQQPVHPAAMSSSDESDATVTESPTPESVASAKCVCAVGYACACADVSKRLHPVGQKRKYTFSAAAKESLAARARKPSALSEGRHNWDGVKLRLEKGLRNECCKRRCLQQLWEKAGDRLVTACHQRWSSIYSGNQNLSFEALRNVLLKGCRGIVFSYEFDHDGVLDSLGHGPVIRTCAAAWEVLHNTSKGRRTAMQNSAIEDDGRTFLQQREARDVRIGGAREHARQFLSSFFSEESGHCEIMPYHNGNSETFKRHLPSWMTKQTVYETYQKWCETERFGLAGKQAAVLKNSTCIYTSFRLFQENHVLKIKNDVPV